MTQFAQPSFSVMVGETQRYRDNWDKIFSKKAEEPAPPPPDLCGCGVDLRPLGGNALRVHLDCPPPKSDEFAAGRRLAFKQILAELCTPLHPDKPECPCLTCSNRRQLAALLVEIRDRP